MTNAKTLEEVIKECKLGIGEKYVINGEGRGVPQKYNIRLCDYHIKQAEIQAIALSVRQHYKECLSVKEIEKTIIDTNLTIHKRGGMRPSAGDYALAISSKVGEIK